MANLPAVSPDRSTATSASSQGLARNAIINTLGLTLPVVAALGAIPILITALGRERFGLLTLAWAVLGWFTVFDAGLGRATTHMVAASKAEHQPKNIRGIAGLSIGLLLAFGLVGGAGAATATPWLVGDVLQLRQHLRTEAETSFFILAAALPLVLASAGARGLLEGCNRFGLVNVIRIPASLLLFLGPLAALPFTHDLRVVIAIVAGTRVLVFVAFMVAALGEIPQARNSNPISRGLIKRTLSYAGWTGLTNALGTVIALGYLDRFVIGALVSVEGVAFYATPLEVATKLWLFPMAIMAVLFPAFTGAHITTPARLVHLYSQGLKAVALLLAPLTVVLIASADVLLRAWVGADFADAGTRVAQLLVLGAFCNSLGQVPFTVLQATGRADVTALRHVVQLPAYVALAYFATKLYGIEGTAVVWCIWATTDMVALFWLAHRLVPTLRADLRWRFAAAAAVPLMALSFLVSALVDVRLQVTCAIVLGVATAVMLGTRLLDVTDRAAVRESFRAKLRLLVS